MPIDLDHVKQVMKEADCLYNQQQIEAAMDSMAADITQTLQDSNPIVYSVMNGGLIIAGQLLTRLNFPMEVGYLHATRYRNKLSGGELFWKARAEHSLVGRSVLIIDDILDEGHTLAAIVEYCRDAGAEQVLTCVLLDKRHDRKAIQRKTGARGLRSILEDILLDSMFELPSLEGVEEVVVNVEVVEGRARPLYIYADRREDVGTGA